MITHQHHDHDHDEISAGPHTHLTSVGIDIGSSTSHLMFSELRIGYPSFHHRRPVVLQRKVIARSPVLLTPFSEDWNIEAEPLRALIDTTFCQVGLSREKIDTGVVVITGEAARKDNARKIAELFSSEAGRFVCATAGPTLETIMAAHGSGTVHRSREEGLSLLNIDLGGGTTKVSLVRKGSIQTTAALNIGARLLIYDGNGILKRIERAGRHFLGDIGSRLEIGDRIDEEVLQRLAAKMARSLYNALSAEKPARGDLFLTPPMGMLPAVDGLLFSGGVSEYIYDREERVFGDLGPYLGREVRREAEERGFRVFDASEGIRATVIGASQYTVQLSGETIFLPDDVKLPIRNLRVFGVCVNWEPPVAERATKAIQATLKGLDPEVQGSPFVLLFSSPPFVGYGAAQELAEGIRRALSPMSRAERPQMLVFEQNVGRVIGEILAPELNIPCVDEVSLSELDFIDVGERVNGESYVPVVVKSLAFGV